MTTARNLADNVTMMRLLRSKRDEGNVIGICMGDYGVMSRVLGLRSGSPLPSLPPDGEADDSARALNEAYGARRVDAGAKVYGVSNPVHHSLSPIMMNTAFQRETVNAVYLALQTDSLAEFAAIDS